MYISMHELLSQYLYFYGLNSAIQLLTLTLFLTLNRLTLRTITKSNENKDHEYESDSKHKLIESELNKRQCVHNYTLTNTITSMTDRQVCHYILAIGFSRRREREPSTSRTFV